MPPERGKTASTAPHALLSNVQKRRRNPGDRSTRGPKGPHGTPNQMTPLYEAARWGKGAVVKELLDGGADVNVVSKCGGTPLHGAVWRGDGGVVQLLLASGAAVNAKTPAGLTPIFEAAWKDDNAIAQQLLDRGAEVNVKDHNGKTPLHMACMWGSLSVVEQLLDRGANVHAKTSAGETPEDLAAAKGQEEVVAMLQVPTRASRFEAFAMGQRDRLGARSLVLSLDPEVVRMILERS